MAESHACRSCGSAMMHDLGQCTPFAPMAQAGTSIDAGRLLRCDVCGLGQRHPVPDAQALEAMYRDTPAEAMAYPFEGNAAWSLARKQLIARLGADARLRVLDVGCHTGSFLAGLPVAWRRFGVESAVAPIQVARDQHGVEIIAERLETIREEWAGTFDVVTMFDVAEHLIDPATGIQQAARLLKPGGVLLLSSGDLDAWTWRWLGTGHWYLQTPQHLSILSRRFLASVAGRSGLELTSVRQIPHRHAAGGSRCREAIKAVYWGLRERGGVFRIPQRLLQSLPGLRDLRHLQSVPWTMTLSDHFLALFTKP